MFTLLAIGVFIGLAIYYVTTLNFEVGTGFTEAEMHAKKAKYKVVEKEEQKLLK